MRSRLRDAVVRAVERTGLQFEYAGLTMDDEQVWVRVTGLSDGRQDA